MASKSWTAGVDFEALQRELEHMPHGQKKAHQEQFAEMLGISYSTLRREMQRRFGKAKSMTKEEQIPDEVVRAVAKIKAEYDTITLKEDDRTLTTHHAQQIAEDQLGIEGATDWHESTVNAALRRRGHHIKKPRRRIEPDYAGQQFQMDFSRSKHFQIVEPIDSGPEGATDWMLKATAKELHYKDGTARVRAWIAQLRDEYSRLRLIRYYPATAESAMLGTHFLRWCFQRSDDGHLMGELPERLKMDAGSFGKAKITRRLLDKLDIERVLTEPGNAASQGKVERGFRSLWQYEAKIATRILMNGNEHIRLSRLRTLIHRLVKEEQDLRHPTRRSETRGALYQRSLLRHPLQRLGADIRDLATRTWERRADDTGKIEIRGVPFEAPAFAAGHQVLVHRHVDGDFVGELMDGWRAGDPFPVEPYRFEDLDDWSERPRQTYAQEVAQDVRADQQERKEQRKREEHEARIQNLKPSDQRAGETDPESVFDAAEDPMPLTLVEAKARASRFLQERAGLTVARAAAQVSRLVEGGVITEGMQPRDVDAVAADVVDRLKVGGSRPATE